jgi:tetratricopeptide (TPR) repeat protein
MAVPGLAGLSGPQRVWAMLSTGGDVARLLLWPTEQSPDYGPTTLLTGHARDVAALATIVAIVLLVVQSVRRAIRAECPDSRPLAAIGWGLAAYFPASNLLGATGPILAERTLYGVSLGAALLLGWSIERAYDVLRRRAGARLVPAAAVWLASAGTIVAVCVRGFERTAEYARVWRDHPSLFAQIVRADSLNYRGYQLLAMEAQNHDRFDDAARLYQRAYELRPSEPTVMASYGEFLLQVHRPHDALAMAERLFRDRDVWTDPRAVTLYLNAVAATRGVDSVLAAARRLDARAPSARAVLFIGMAYDARGDSAAARAAYRAGLQRSPGDSALAAHLAGRPAQ